MKLKIVFAFLVGVTHLLYNFSFAQNPSPLDAHTKGVDAGIAGTSGNIA